MEFIIANADKKDITLLRGYKSIDIQIGGANDFEIRISKHRARALYIQKGFWCYCHGTEYGGIFTNYESETNGEIMKWGGVTFRGLMKRDVVTPPAGQDYRKVSGEANAIIRTILNENAAVGKIYTVSTQNSGVSFNTHQFPRYRDKLYCLTRMLAEKGLRLKIISDRGTSGGAFKINVEAVPIVDYSNLIEYSQNSKVNIHVIDYDADINHLICLGSGELKDRLRVDLYLQPNGTVSTAKYYTGEHEYVSAYSYGSANTVNELTAAGKKYLLAHSAKVGMEMNSPDFKFDVGDIIAGRDYDTGAYVKNPIVSKILRTDGIVTTEEIDVKGDTENEQEDY